MGFASERLKKLCVVEVAHHGFDAEGFEEFGFFWRADQCGDFEGVDLRVVEETVECSASDVSCAKGQTIRIWSWKYYEHTCGTEVEDRKFGGSHGEGGVSTCVEGRSSGVGWKVDSIMLAFIALHLPKPSPTDSGGIPPRSATA